MNRAYEHGKALWDAGDCSKYIVVLVRNNKVVDYNRPDYWNFERHDKFVEETSHFSDWNYRIKSCPYKESLHYIGTAKAYLKRMCKTYQEILEDEGITID